MKPGEIAVLVIWSASAVKVAGYSWTAYFGEYQKFPAVGGGGGGGAAGTANPQGIGGFIENTVAAITNPGELISGLGTAISNFFGG